MITFHDLRHTCTSLLFQRNVHPKFVQELLGHASVSITLDTYSHMLPGMGGEAADAIGEALGWFPHHLDSSSIQRVRRRSFVPGAFLRPRFCRAVPTLIVEGRLKEHGTSF